MEFSAVVASHVTHLIRGVTQSNFGTLREELNTMIATFGFHMERTIFQQVLTTTKQVKNLMAPDANEKIIIRLLNSELDKLSHSPNFISVAADTEADEDFLTRLFVVVTSVAAQAALAVALAHSSTPTCRTMGMKLLSKKILPEMSHTAIQQVPEIVVRHFAHLLIANPDIFSAATLDPVALDHTKLVLAENKILSKAQLSKALAAETHPADDGVAFLSLAGILEELGPACLVTAESFREVLKVLPAALLNPSQIAEALGVILNPHTSPLGSSGQAIIVRTFNSVHGTKLPTDCKESSWNLQVFTSEINTRVKALDWSGVLTALDFPKFKLDKLTTLQALWQSACGGSMPIEPFCGNWKNQRVQLAIIKAAVGNNANVLSQPLITESLLYIGSNPEFYYDAKKTLDDLMRTHPDLLLERLLGCKNAAYASFQRELVRTLIVQLLTQLSDTSIANCVETNIKIFLSALNDAHHMEVIKPEAIVDICRRSGAKVIAEMLLIATSPSLAFSIATSCSLSGTSFGSIRGFLLDVFQGKTPGSLDPTALCVTAIEYLEERFAEVKEKEQAAVVAAKEAGTTPPPEARVQFEANVAENIVEILNAMESPHVPTMVAAHTRELLEELKQRLGQILSARFPRPVEDAALQLFQRVFNGNITVPDLLSHIITLRDSADQVDIYNCLLKKLFEEFKFFGTYPERELLLAAQIYGGLLSRGVLNNTTGQQSIAFILRCVLTSIFRPQSEALRRFAISALDEFKQRLPEWPAYCQHLSQAQGDLERYIPGISSYISGAQAGARAGATRAVAPVVIPSQALQDRVSFLINNLDQQNMQQFSTELRGVIQAEMFPFFSEYLVGKRVALEPNFHRNYVSLIESLELAAFEAAVMQVTYKMIRQFLSSDKIRTASGDRSVLKNLGAWIGLLTLARDRPVYAKDLDLRELLLLAMAEGKLIAVVPFVAKVLENTSSSRVFTPRNPWLMGILNTLAEIYQFPDLKLTLRFEVEVLCNKISISIQEIIERSKVAPGSLHLKLEEIYRTLDITNSTDFHQATVARTNVDVVTAPVVVQQAPQVAQAQQQPARQAASIPPQSAAPTTTATQQAKSAFDNLALQIQARIPVEQLVIFQQVPQLQQIPRLAIESALKEIIHPVVERSVVIACNTTRELIVKDFLSDPDDAKLRRSAQLMARNLASNLAMVTCKDPLRAGIRKVMTSMLNQQTPMELQQMIPETVEVVLRENADAGVSVVERVAADSATSAIEEAIAPYLEERRKQKAIGQFPNVRIFDDRALHYMSALPDQLRPRAGLEVLQKRVYEDFGQPSQVVASASGQGNATATTQPPAPVAVPPSPPTAPNPPPVTAHEDRVTPAIAAALEDLNRLIVTIESETQKHYQSHPDSILSLTQQSFAHGSLSPHHDLVKASLCRIPNIITADNALHFCRHVFLKLAALSERIIQVGTQDRTSRVPQVLTLISETYLLVLQSSREKDATKRAVVQELTRLLLSHERRWQFKDMTVNFIRLRLIDISELDRYLTTTLTSEAARHIVEFAGTIVQRCLVDEKLASQKDLKNTLDALEKIAQLARKGQQQQQAPPQPVVQSTTQAQAAPQPTPAAPAAQTLADPEANTMRVRIPTYITDQELRIQVRQYFREWIQICLRKIQQPGDYATGQDQAAASQPTPQQQAMSFVGKLQQGGMLKADHMLEKFLALLMEISVEEYCTTAAQLAEAQRASGENKEVPKPRPANVTIPTPPPSSIPSDPKLFVWVDAFSDLIVLLIKCCAWGTANNPQQRREGQAQDQPRSQSIQAEVALVNRVLQVVSKMLVNNHDYFVMVPNVGGLPPMAPPHVAQTQFQQQPYFRFLSNLIIALYPPPADDPGLTVSEILSHFANTLAALNPTRLPGFAFAWLELISHRIFMSKLLINKSTEGWSLFHKLIIQCLRFMEPYLRAVDLTDGMRLFYKASMKILLVLLHDFPDFLCTYHVSLCDVIPPSCIQLRNVILSSFPRNMKLPDPFTPNLKVDLLPEISQAPQLQDKYKEALIPKSGSTPPPITQQELDSYLTTRRPNTFPRSILSRLKLPTPLNGVHYNTTVLNAMVLYLGAQTVIELQKEDAAGDKKIDDSPAMDIYRELAQSMDSEGRYLMLNAMVNQLRYPNNHTHYFSCVVLHLFAHPCPDLDIIQEQITRTLLERLIVNRPHPWGLLITFIELVKNPRYDFWSKPFIKCTPELERLFESVGQTCVGSHPATHTQPGT